MNRRVPDPEEPAAARSAPASTLRSERPDEWDPNEVDWKAVLSAEEANHKTRHVSALWLRPLPEFICGQAWKAEKSRERQPIATGIYQSSRHSRLAAFTPDANPSV